ncbi:SRPBCC domain-containing protein [Patescibacteria group bacterium]|nr:SRPBCC domain-containing protein [Patescibacteria group bacterium]
MPTLHFSTVINAPKEQVWKTMLEDATYRQWTEAFMPGSHVVGNWKEGSKIQFLAADESGKLSGMTSQIAVNKQHEFISIHHLGIVNQGVEDTTSAEAKKWVGFENYTFTEQDGQTTLTVDLDVPQEFVEEMNKGWSAALAKLKEIAEK